MVGDAVHDLAMGRAARVALNVGVLSGTSGREDFEGLADLILDSINDLPAPARVRLRCALGAAGRIREPSEPLRAH